MTLPASLQLIDAERRTGDRKPVRASGDIVHRSGTVDVDVLDLSLEGFRARFAGDLTVGGWIKLKVEGQTSPEAQVRWRRGDEYGFSFAFPIYPEFLAAAFSNGAAPANAPEAKVSAKKPPAKQAGRTDVSMSWTDYAARRCHVGGRTIGLSPLMTEMLSVLLMRRGEAMASAEIARAIWPSGDIDSKRMATFRVTMCALRQRIPNVITAIKRGSFIIWRD